jgi:hypothetical protein
MSLAPEFPPVVHIPALARRRSGLRVVDPDALAPQPHRAVGDPRCLVDPGTDAGPAKLRLVPVALVPAERPVAIPRVSPVRLTRRGRMTLALLGLATAGVVLGIAHASAPGAGSSAVADRSSLPAVVTVQAGDTLWSIAGQVAPGRDPRAEVDDLQRINHLASVALVAGQVLRTR